jgi:hypothetical protein
MTKCDFQEDGDGYLTCAACGYQIRYMAHRKCPGNPPRRSYRDEPTITFEEWTCIYRSPGPVKTVRPLNCGRRKDLVPVHRCQLFGLCAMRPIRTKEGRVQGCLTCKDRVKVISGEEDA